MVWDKFKSWTLNQLSHPGAPVPFNFKFNLPRINMLISFLSNNFTFFKISFLSNLHPTWVLVHNTKIRSCILYWLSQPSTFFSSPSNNIQPQVDWTSDHIYCAKVFGLEHAGHWDPTSLKKTHPSSNWMRIDCKGAKAIGSMINLSLN